MKFRNRIKDGAVDVWWLYDDGGLTWLLAYLLTTHPSFVEVAPLNSKKIKKLEKILEC
jgi:hypothetical protein